MPINYYLEIGSTREQVAVVLDPDRSLKNLIERSQNAPRPCFRLLDFIADYGAVYFNELQMEELLKELKELRDFADNPNEQDIINKIEELANRCKDSGDLFLLCRGD